MFFAISEKSTSHSTYNIILSLDIFFLSRWLFVVGFVVFNYDIINFVVEIYKISINYYLTTVFCMSTAPSVF